MSLHFLAHWTLDFNRPGDLLVFRTRSGNQKYVDAQILSIKCPLGVGVRTQLIKAIAWFPCMNISSCLSCSVSDSTSFQRLRESSRGCPKCLIPCHLSEALVPGFGLVQHWFLWLFGEYIKKWEITHSLSFCFESE